MGVAGVDAKTILDLVESGMGQNEGPSVKVLLFAALRDQAGWEERQLPLPSAGTTSALDLWLALDLGPWSDALRVAVNQVLVDPQASVVAGDELAFLPPFTGG